MIFTECKHDDFYVWKKEKLEQQIKSVSSALRSVEIRMENSYLKGENYAINSKSTGNLEHQLDSLTKEYEKIKLHIERDWYKGLKRPYEKILNNLTKQGYDLTDFEDSNFVPYGDEKPDKYQKILSIYLKPKWNMEDATKIKNLIMKTLPFEPEVDKYSAMKWTSSKYDVEMYKTGGSKIKIMFMIK
jgi:hypothetical protein